MPQVDLNHDGRVDINDLQILLRSLGDRDGNSNVDLGGLSDEARASLLAGLGRHSTGNRHNSGGRDSVLSPLVTRLRSTAAGRKILRGLDTNGDGELSAQELAVAWGTLRTLAINPDVNGDGTLNLDDLPPWVVRPLVEAYDTNADGKLTSADLENFLNSLEMSDTMREVVQGLDTNGDGRIDLNDVPDDLAAQIVRAADRNGDGVLSLGDLSGEKADQLLSQLDTNHDGKINAQDVPAGLGLAALSALDTNGDRTISVRELAKLLGPKKAALWDRNSDGVVDLNDLPEDGSQQVVASLLAGEQSIKLADLPQGTARAYLSQLDTDHDNAISAADLPPALRAALAAMSVPATSSSLPVGSIDTDAVTKYLEGLAAGDTSASADAHAHSPPHAGGSAAWVILLVLFFICIGVGVVWYFKKVRKLPEERRRLGGHQVRLMMSRSITLVSGDHVESRLDRLVVKRRPPASHLLQNSSMQLPSEFTSPLHTTGLVQVHPSMPPRGSGHVEVTQPMPPV